MNATLEKTAPIGSDWPKYLELIELDAAIVALKAAADHPIAMDLLQAKRSQIAVWLQNELDAIQGRHDQANIDRAWTIKTATPIAEYERLIAEGNIEVERLERVIAAMDAHDRFQAPWTGEIQALDQTRERIKSWEKAITEHPTKLARYQPRPVPEFVTIPEAPNP
jgi:hypothetical protein